MIDAITNIAEAMDRYGPALILISCLLVLNGFFIVRDWRRESSLQGQIAELQKLHFDTILPLLAECKEAVASCGSVIAQNSQIIAGFHRGGS